MRLILTCAAAWLLMAAATLAGEPPRPNPDTVVLDLEQSSFRAFVGWKTPTLISADGKLKPLLEPKRKELKDEDRKPLAVRSSAPPPANWFAPEFDDSVWPRCNKWVTVNSWMASAPYADKRYASRNVLEGNLVCMRGTFKVADPAQVKDLRLDLGFTGGAVVYVNGAELGRAHLQEGKLAPETMATPYPEDAYVTADKKFRPYVIDSRGGTLNYKTPEFTNEALKGRRREFAGKDGAPGGLAIPSSALRKGANVIAIEVRAAPVNELVFELTDGKTTWTGEHQKPFPHCMVVSARLIAPSAAGLDGAGLGSGIQLANVQSIDSVYVNETPALSAKLNPIRMVGARNGVFSGKVVLTSAEAVRNLKAFVSDLTGADGKAKIPAAAVQVRRAELTAPQTGWAQGQFDRLVADFPASVPQAGNRKQVIVPIWVTVPVPADAAAGEYKGTLTVEAEGAAAAKFDVPVELKVHDWKAPDPKDFVIHHNFYQSPDSVARYYNVPMWSDKHFELMGKSLAAFKQVGNRMCVASLLADSFTLGNSEGMVRWVKKADPSAGSGQAAYDYDFTILDKYLDLYEKTSGKPGVLRLDAWQRINEAKAKSGQTVQNVSVFDPATGKVDQLPQPPFGTPENEAFWRPVLVELKKRLDKRGWYDVAAFGWVHYSKPADPQMVDVFKKIWPDGKWMHTAHTCPLEYQGTTKDVKMPVMCDEYVWGCGDLYDPDNPYFQKKYQNQYPQHWRHGPKSVILGFPRFGVQFINALYDGSRLAAYKAVTEMTIQGNLWGLGYLGGDFWPVQSTGEKKRLVRVSYGGQGIDMQDAVVACFSPGPDGAAFNERMEIFREGVQVGEAIFFLQRAMEDKKVSPEVAKKINDLLDERARHMLRAEEHGSTFHVFAGSGWQERDDRLFALCAEVAKAMGGK
ncbi:MAG TPA: DUF6067 family protein [Planctomycetota bacterium]|nr:DUF6067 family protein [Planctomycetota bacterium]